MIALPKTKLCTKCGEHKALGEFSPSRKGKFGKAARCKVCLSQIAKQRTAADPIKTREISRKSKAKHACRINANRRIAYNMFPESERQRRRKYYRNHKEKVLAKAHLEVSNLTDAYVIKSGRLPANAPPALIEAKRIQLKIKRLLKDGNQ